MEKKFEIAFAQQETIDLAQEDFGIDPAEFIREAIESHYRKLASEQHKRDIFALDKGMRAIERALSIKGYTVLDHDFMGFDLVATDKDGTVVFVKVDMRSGEMPEEKTDGIRSEFEHAAFHYFGENEIANGTPVRCDYVSLAISGNDRAMLRHHVDCISDSRKAA